MGISAEQKDTQATASGQLRAAAGMPSWSKPTDVAEELLIQMYQEMVRLRQFDRKSVALQRAGRIGTYPPLEGQEACQVAAVKALNRADVVFPTYRDYGAMMLHGVPMENILLYWNGRVEGCVIPDDVQVFPIAVPIATQLPHAAGAAWAAKLQKRQAVSLCFFGDGATSEGDFHEALNFAGVFKLPVIFFCENNQYAISVPLARQTATKTIAEKGAAYNVPGVRVDGSDPLAIYRAVRDAVARARAGDGATLIEAVTYRYGAHTTSDDPSKYRAADEAAAWRERDPIDTLGHHLREWGLWNDAQEHAHLALVDEEIRAAVSHMEMTPPPNPDDLFDCLYDTLPPRLIKQRAELRAITRTLHKEV